MIYSYNKMAMLSRFKLFNREKERKVDYLIVGLGNPKEKYKKTAHNIGFRVINLLIEDLNFTPLSKDNTLNSLVTKGRIEEKAVALLLPLTFMNLSGEAVKRAVKKFNVSPARIIVIHDDIDLPLGTIRISVSRSSAGHKGVSSIIKSIGTKDFSRLRIGISKKDIKEKAREVVLKNLPSGISKVEKLAVEELKEIISSEDLSARTVKINENGD